MTLDTSTVVQLCTLVLFLVVHAVGVFKYIESGREKDRQQREEDRQQLTEELAKVHSRINEVKDEYVRRVDLDKELTRIHDSISEIRRDTKEGFERMGNRIDHLSEVVTGSMGKLASVLAADRTREN